MIHEIKCEQRYFKETEEVNKPFEVRKNDRDYRAGDYLAMNEVDEDGAYTGRSMVQRVTYVLDEPAYCKDGYVVMGIEPCKVMKMREAYAFGIHGGPIVLGRRDD